MMKHWMGILPLAILAGCSSPDPAALVGPIEDQVGVGLALTKDCNLLTDRKYSILFGYVMETFDLMGSDRFSKQIDKAQEIEKQYGCESAEVAAIAQVPVLMYSLNEQARQASGETQGQPAGVPPTTSPTPGPAPVTGEATPAGQAPVSGEVQPVAPPAAAGVTGQGAPLPVEASPAVAPVQAPEPLPAPAPATGAAPAAQ